MIATASCVDACVDRHAAQGGVDVGERLVGFEEEVTRDADPRESPVLHLDVDRHELATGNLVLTTHASHNTAPGLRMPGAAYRGRHPVRSAQSFARCHAPSNHGSLAAT